MRDSVSVSARGGHLTEKPGAWVDLALTLPIFVGYQLGVVFLKVKNASDLVTGPLLQLANGSRLNYLGMTLGIGVVFAGVFALLGRGHAFRFGKFIQIAIEGAVYAVVMRLVANFVVGNLPMIVRGLGPKSHGLVAATSPMGSDPMTGFVMSLGAGFYEELAFRVVLFGLGAKLLVLLLARERMNLVDQQGPRLTLRGFLVMAVWALVSAAVFSGVHYVGALGDKFELGSFVFRFVLGLALTLIFVFRGFAAAVWTHALYDAWVLVL
jgi:Type II CAAX prenyl endopeptidase Rce1-like